MQKFLERAVVVLKAAPTYLVAAATIATIITEEVAEELPAGAAEWAVRIGGKVVSVIAAAVLIVRRVTPVIEEQRGLLPPAGPVIPEANVDGD
jgi:hypothetical protein